MNTIKSLLLDAPDGHMDASLKELIGKWGEEPTALELLHVIDLAIYSSLMSGFLLTVIQSLYATQCSREKVTHDELVPLAVWRKELEK